MIPFILAGENSSVSPAAAPAVARLTELLNLRNTTIFCPHWKRTDFKSVSKEIGRALILNPDPKSVPCDGHASLIFCAGQFEDPKNVIELLHSGANRYGISPRLILFSSESDLKILEDIDSIPINHPIYEYNVETMDLWETYCLEQVRYRYELGNLDPVNATALRLTAIALKSKNIEDIPVPC